MYNYESPIIEVVQDLTRNVIAQEEKYVIECIKNVGIDVDREELIKALQYDRQQYYKGYEDGLNQISQDFKKVIEIVFSNKYPEYKEDELIELLKPYKRESD